MAIFQFRLAAVLRLRARVKDEKQWELRGLNETRNRAVAEIDALEQQLRASEEALGGTSDQLLSAIDLQLHAEYALRIDKRIKEESPRWTFSTSASSTNAANWWKPCAD